MRCEGARPLSGACLRGLCSLCFPFASLGRNGLRDLGKYVLAPEKGKRISN